MNPHFNDSQAHAHPQELLIDRFESQKANFKNQLNGLVDDLFGFMFTEFNNLRTSNSFCCTCSCAPLSSSSTPSTNQNTQNVQTESQQPIRVQENSNSKSTNHSSASINGFAGSLEVVSRIKQEPIEEYNDLSTYALTVSGPSTSPSLLSIPNGTQSNASSSAVATACITHFVNYQQQHQSDEQIQESLEIEKHDDDDEECQCDDCLQVMAFEFKAELHEDADTNEFPEAESGTLQCDEQPALKRLKVDHNRLEPTVLVTKNGYREHSGLSSGLESQDPPAPRDHDPSQNNLPVPQTRRFPCPFPGCDQAFTWQSHLRVHQRTHTGVRPYLCSYPGCGGLATFTQKRSAIEHVRMLHFGLPKTMKQQKELNIVDERDPHDFVQVFDDLL